MSENSAELSEKTFDSYVAKGKWIVDFWAEWCMPCKIMAPHFEAVAKEMHGKINFGKVNVEENYELTDKFSIRGIPTTLFLKNGDVVHSEVGAINKEALKEIIGKVF